jgi:hypothetical protein
MKMSTAEEIKARIEARKLREAEEAQERAANGGKTLAEIRAEGERRYFAMVQERQGRAFTYALNQLGQFLDSLPPVTEEQKQDNQEARRA